MKQTLIIILTAILFASCNYTPNSNSDDTLASKTEASMNEANAQLGMPAIVNYQEKKLLKSIYELRDNATLINYAYLFSNQTGKLIFIGKCLGYGLPYATQYSNPQKYIVGTSEYSHELPQAEPNGLFMPSDAHATWLMMLDDKGHPHPTYVEPDIIVSQFQLSTN